MQKFSSGGPALQCILDFNVTHHVEFGTQVIVSGSSPSLGQWNLSKAIKLRWKQGDCWIGRVQCNLELDYAHLNNLEFKFVETHDSGQAEQWENGNNRIISDVLVQMEKFKKECNSEESVRVIVKNIAAWEQHDATVSTLFVPIRKKSKAVVVLGRKLLPNGEASHILKGRMVVASKVFMTECNVNNDLMLVTGGKVTSGVGVLSEAEVMQQLAIKEGVKKSQTILEDQSMNLIENALYSKDLLEEQGIESIIVITSDFHMARSLKVFQAVLGSSFLLDSREDHPTLSEEEKNTTAKVEAIMGPKLKEHLAAYIGN